MIKQLLSTAMLAAFVGVGNVQAQDLSNHTYYDFGNTVWTDADGFEMPCLGGVFNKVSANGQYAVGYDDQITFAAFMWNRTTPDAMDIVNTNASLRIYLCDVANDGTVVGSYEGDDGLGMFPAYRTPEGEWVVLPVPEDYSVKGATSQGENMARAITPDGSHIAGQIYIKTGETESPFDGSIVERRELIPLLWTKNGDAYELTFVGLNLGEAGKSMYIDPETQTLVTSEKEVNDQTYFVYDISDDGSTIVGMNTADTGGQNPMLIRDGQLIQLFDCANDATYTFNGGICSSIDANGNIYGYFMDDDMSTIAFVYTAEGEMVYTDSWYICGDANGNMYTQSSGSLSYTLDCSDDGSVLVGGGVGDFGFGASNVPALLFDATSTGISRLDAAKANVGIKCMGKTVCVTGEYARADVYNAQGALIATGGQGKAFSLEGQPTGAYIVKVTTANGVKTFKVAR